MDQTLNPKPLWRNPILIIKASFNVFEAPHEAAAADMPRSWRAARVSSASPNKAAQPLG